MSKVTFQHKCTECEQEYSQETIWIDPELYTDPEAAIKTTAFWCPNRSCARGQAVMLQMLPNSEAVIVEALEYQTLIKDDNPSYYTSKTTTAEKVTEEAALSVIGQAKE